MSPIAPGQTLLIDADDTLWENNIYFEHAIDAFLAFLDHPELSPEAVRIRFNAIEHESVRASGYGLPSFTRSMLVCYETLSPRPLTDEIRRKIHSFARAIADHPIELLPGVARTLAHLASRHRLILMTKGVPQEQSGKLARSGLASHFSAVEIVAEKDPPAYARVIERHGLSPHDGWMIGNSPKSDINPALAAGLNAVFLFHPATWVLEHATLATPPHGQKLLEFDAFSHLADYF